MFSLLKRRPLLDDLTVQWLSDCYAWALQQFDAQVFRDTTQLVLPNDRFFPGRVDSIDGMANLIFDKVKSYAGVAHWPTRLMDGSRCSLNAPVKPVIDGPLRRSDGMSPDPVAEEQRLPILYDPALVNNPEAMIAGLAHQLAHYLALQAETTPPGGKENWAQATEVLAVFLGFGPMIANSAFNVRIPRCGSCAPQPADRKSFLSQYDLTYALAIFCVLKGVSNREVLPSLKGPLRGFFKRAVKEVAANGVALERLKQIA
ncbi:MAG: hypothetical protein R6X15_00150 [Pseudomonadota bacterium]